MSTSKANLPTGENQDEERGLASTLSSRPMGFILKYELTILRLFQIVWVPLELFLQPLLAWVFRLRGVSHYVVRRTEKGYENADELFKEAAKIFREAEEIRIAVGEAGHQLMEHPELINGLQHAFEKNQATIEIVHGPRVDSKTQRVYDLAKKDIVGMFMMEKYKGHHFILVTGPAGEVSVIDEGTHNETRWMESKDGELVPVLGSRARLHYIIKHSNRRVRYLRDEYERRKNAAYPIFENPLISSPQKLSPLRILADVLLNFPNKHFLQPLSIISDFPLDLLVRNLYHEVTRGDKASKNGLEPSPDSSVLMKSPEYILRPRPPFVEEPAFITHFEIDITLEQVPNNDPCELCERLIPKTPLTWELAYSRSILIPLGHVKSSLLNLETD